MPLKHGYGKDNPNWRGGNAKTCLTCGQIFHAHDCKNRPRKYCSRKCRPCTPIEKLKEMAAKAAALRSAQATYIHLRTCICVVCGKVMRIPERRKYCSDECRQSRRPIKVPPQPNHICAHCGRPFHAYDTASRPRKYCSYSCHLLAGGAHRAGEESVKKTALYGSKKDANHSEIVRAFEKLGASVLDLSALGCGVPDLLVWCCNGWHLVDVKNPKTGYGRRGLNPRQQRWALNWKGGPVYLIKSIEDVVALVNGNSHQVQNFGGWGSEATALVQNWRRNRSSRVEPTKGTPT